MGEPETFPPVETEADASMRQLGLRVLGDRYRVLLDRANRRPLLPSEREELTATAAALEQLQSMAPVGRAAVTAAPAGDSLERDHAETSGQG